MVDPTSKHPKIVGNFIRQRREALGLSQRALGLMFNPPVTTQFISNVERGVTPLPPSHVPTLTQALNVSEQEIMGLLEREYALKLSGRLGKPISPSTTTGEGSQGGNGTGSHPLSIAVVDFDFFRSVYEAYQRADTKTRQAFATVCETILNVPKRPAPSPADGASTGQPVRSE